MPAFSGPRHVPARRVRPSLRDPRFALLIAGQSVNSVGSWASAIVLWGFAAYRFSASPQEISVTVLCWSAPPAVLSPLTGALADRFGPRTMMIAGYLGAAAAALAMAAAGSLASLDVMAAAYGAARSLSGPAGTLGRVMGVISTAESATETVSMPLAGAILAVAGIRPGALALAAVAVAAGATCLRW